MLRALQIRNFALIENVNLELGEGLNILSGETGAGKSILIQALDLLLGARGSSELIRQGEEESEVTGLFVRGDEEIGLRRVISRSGKNKAYLNERPVPVSALEEAGRALVDLAGQHEHQVLLHPERHLSLLDEFAGLESKEDSPLCRYRALFDAVGILRAEREKIEARAREAREREEFLRFQLKEISQAGLKPGEEEGLQKERDASKHAVRLKEAGTRAEEALDSGEDSIAERLARVEKEIRQASQLDSRLSELSSRLGGVLVEVQDAAKSLRTYAEAVSCDPERLQEIEDRLDLIARLKKKHGGSVEALLEKEQEIRKSLALVDDFDGAMAAVDRDLSERGKNLLELAGVVSKARKKASEELSGKVGRELKDLGMPAARFAMELRPPGRGLDVLGSLLGENGAEEGEFLVAPNLGEGLHALAKVASGGELSRVFLAIKKVLGASRTAGTCVFDEVDAGIGGRIAEVVGRNLSDLSKRRQVICITHLPQIACFADHHFIIRKETEKGRTRTQVQRLQSAQREEEIARMLAGVKVTEQAKAHAREMIKGAARG
ncbi:MAG TPA: DNA repair protein RecN [bacterium]|nr:DNA repair protein RecN [bacterium]